MGVRFRKSVKICKGVRVNFGKRGASVSFGTKGLHKTIHTSGRVTSTVGIPGTGISYSTSSGGRKNTNRSTSRSSYNNNVRAQQQKEIEQENNARMVQDYNNLLNEIRSIHKLCSDKVDWNYLRDVPAPFDPMSPGPLEVAALNKRNELKPSLFGKILPSIDRNRENKLDQAIVEAREMDLENYTEWENLQKLATEVLDGDIDSYFYVVSEMHPFDDILDYGSDFEVGTDIPDLMEVEFRVKSDKVVPNHVLSLTSTGKLSSKNMTKTMHYDITQDYICSCVIRIARELFALLPIKYVVIHAVDSILNTATGYQEDATVISVKIDRQHFEKINFNGIDPSDAIETFENHLDFKKTQGLKPVTRIDA